MDAHSLIHAEHARRAAMAANDAEAIGQWLADRFHYAHINGVIDDRAGYLAPVANGKVRCLSTEACALKADLRQGYALLTGESGIAFERADGSARGEVRTWFTSMWELHAGSWRISAFASTPLPDGA